MALDREGNEIDDSFIANPKDNRYVDNDEIVFEDAYDAFPHTLKKTDEFIDELEIKPSNKLRGFFIELCIYAFIIFLCIYIIPNYVVQRTIVDGASMEDTLFDEENLMVEKISYRLNQLNRFDIIVFYPLGREIGDYYVKRIIGLPGETVQIIGSDILINGKILKEDYGKDPISDAGRAGIPIVLADDEFFVMGDNRSISQDSRSNLVGNVKKENIGGRAFLRIWPLSEFGAID